jgi:hypothetical protein
LASSLATTAALHLYAKPFVAAASLSADNRTMFITTLSFTGGKKFSEYLVEDLKGEQRMLSNVVSKSTGARFMFDKNYATHSLFAQLLPAGNKTSPSSSSSSSSHSSSSSSSSSSSTHRELTDKEVADHQFIPPISREDQEIIDDWMKRHSKS